MLDAKLMHDNAEITHDEHAVALITLKLKENTLGPQQNRLVNSCNV